MTKDQCLAVLPEARAALHTLRLGGAVVSVGYGDRRIQYSQANFADLSAYVAELENLCGDPQGPRRRPFQMIW